LPIDRILLRIPYAFLCALWVAVSAVTFALAQEKQTKNPYADNAAAPTIGRERFVIRCAPCHGMNARGGHAPDLTSASTAQKTDTELFRTISRGVPGTAMMGWGESLREEEIWMVVSYLRSLSANADLPVTGNQKAGEKIFFGMGGCSQCHMVNGKGGRLGPELSRIGLSRSARFIRESIREPDKDLAEGLREPGKRFPVFYDTVTVVTNDGRRYVGVAKNEDTFTLQLMDQQEQLHLFFKSDLREVSHQQKSLMPTYTEQILSENELQDLLAYLVSLQGR
jgi:cytochrome c oxidase cbb3-type subunit 3